MLNKVATLVFAAVLFCSMTQAQTLTADQAAGSATAKNGFRNENEIAAKFADWQNDADAAEWLKVLGHTAGDVIGVAVSKPNGEKADLYVTVKTASGDVRHGISIKLVSNTSGFNQIDKRWLSQYVKKWSMPSDVAELMKLFVGETPPRTGSRDARRMFLNEFTPEERGRVLDFFTANRDRIVTDLIAGGDGFGKADWFMVALKDRERPRWKMISTAEAIRFFGEGRVELSSGGNLRIGRITMQRKGGDGGRETAKMLQFKLNPAAIFDTK